jgi:murein L,D-transpeptidase YcbB/YkuD
MGDAADIIVNGVAPLEVAKFAESIGIKGIGLYSTFTHIDTREKKSFWYGQDEEKRETFGGSSNNPSNSPTNSQLTTVSKISVMLPTIQKGSNGAYVKIAQALLSIAADGDFGKDTKKAVEQFQKKRNIKQDGIIGETTWKALFS